MRVNALICVLQANKYKYAKFLWDDEEALKKTWITKNMRKWALLYPLQSQQAKAKLKQKREKTQSNAECKKINKCKEQDKAKNQVKGKYKANGRYNFQAKYSLAIKIYHNEDN